MRFVMMITILLLLQRIITGRGGSQAKIFFYPGWNGNNMSDETKNSLQSATFLAMLTPSGSFI
jgi:hypothetical protein